MPKTILDNAVTCFAGPQFDAIELRSKETGGHVCRVALMCELLAENHTPMNNSPFQPLAFNESDVGPFLCFSVAGCSGDHVR